MLTDEGYTEGVGWQLLRNLQGLTAEMDELLRAEEAAGNEPAAGDHDGHRHHRAEIAARYDWHYWPDNGTWMVEHMASGRTQSVATAIRQ